MKPLRKFVAETMAVHSEREYLLRRFTQEQELACAARDRRMAAIHASMAAEYQRRLIEAVSRPLLRQSPASVRGGASASS